MESVFDKELIENDIHYTLVGDYYFPTCTITATVPVIGKWADLYKQYLQEKRPLEYARLIWMNQLNDLLESIQRECNERLENYIRQMAETEGVTETLKFNEPMAWVQRMNSIRNRAEEIVIRDMLV